MTSLTLNLHPEGKPGYTVTDNLSGELVGEITLRFDPEVVYTFVSTDGSIHTTGAMMIHVFQQLFGADVDLDFPDLDR